MNSRVTHKSTWIVMINDFSIDSEFDGDGCKLWVKCSGSSPKPNNAINENHYLLPATEWQLIIYLLMSVFLSSITNLWISAAKFIADTPYIPVLFWKWLTNLTSGADHIHDGWLSAILVWSGHSGTLCRMGLKMWLLVNHTIGYIFHY